MKIKLNTTQRLVYETLKLSSKRRARAYREQLRPPLRSQLLDNLKSLRDGPVIVVGFMSSSIGLGVAARKLVASLRSVQIEPRIHDLSAEFHKPQIYPDWRKSIGECPEGGTVILCMNPPEIPHALSKLPARILEGRWLIGYLWWELEQNSARVAIDRAAIRRSLGLVGVRLLGFLEPPARLQAVTVSNLD